MKRIRFLGVALLLAMTCACNQQADPVSPTGTESEASAGGSPTPVAWQSYPPEEGLHMQTAYITADNVRFYAAPSLDAAVLDILNTNDIVYYLQENPDGWYEVTRGEYVYGFICSEYASPQPIGQDSVVSATPLELTAEMRGNAKKATNNEWVSDISCTVSEAAQTEYGEKKLISFTFKNVTPDKTFISFEFVALLFDADGNPVGETNARVFSNDNIGLQPGDFYDRGDQGIIPLEAAQAKACIKSILYMDSGEHTWDNPYINDWILVEKDSC